MIVTVKVKPNAKESKILGWEDKGTMIVSISEPATAGKANRALIQLLATHFGIAKSLIEIKRGHNARIKHISIPK